MILPLRTMFLPRGPSRSASLPLQFDVLETRALLSTVVWPGLVNAVQQMGANYTLNAAQDLGTLSSSAQTGVVGVLGNGPAGAAEVDWYSFTLTSPSQVTLSTLDHQAGSPFVSVLTLYNNDPNDWNDPFDPLGHRILAQSDGASQGGDASISMTLGPGTYYVAVSGSGNQYFEPFLDGSGYNGSTGAYGLQITTAPTGINPMTDGPTVLYADPAAGSVLAQSPFVIRVDFSASLDPNTIVPGQNVQLLWNATGDFGNGQDQIIPIASVNFSSAVNELQMTPQAPLAPGYYEVVLFGNSAQHGVGQVLTGLNGDPLGENSAHPQGEDYTYTFQIDGIKGNTGPDPTADNTIATAQQLGNITQAGLVQIAGAIGNNPDDQAFNPNDVDIYNFQISGPGNYALTSEVFAGRIGSPLDAALTLYQWNPITQSLTLVAVNDNSFNTTLDAEGFESLFLDPVLFAGLTQGDYYLVVSSGGNVPDPTMNPVWSNGSSNPTIPDSGQDGYSIGNYVLNLEVQPDFEAPQVISVTPTPGANLTGPPAQFVVQFSEPVNIQQLAYQNYLLTGTGAISAVYITDASGNKYYPQLLSYNYATNQAVFYTLNPLPNGSYTFHLSGPGGLTDLGGNPLIGNNPSGDYTFSFQVQGPARGSPGNPLTWLDQESNSTLAGPQIIGPVFPDELASGIVLMRNFTQDPASAPHDTADYYQIQLLQNQQNYGFFLQGVNGQTVPAGVTFTVYNASGNVIIPAISAQQLVQANLNAGVYTIAVTGWTSTQAPNISYQLDIKLIGTEDNLVPLTVGAAPMLRFQLVADAPPSPVLSMAGIALAGGTVSPMVSLGNTSFSSDGSLRFASYVFSNLSGWTQAPSNGAMVQSVSVIGGVQAPAALGANRAGNFVFVRTLEDLLLNQLLQVSIVTQVDNDTGGGKIDQLGLQGMQVADAVRPLTEYLQQTIDTFFGMWDWLNQGAPPAPSSSAGLPNDAPSEPALELSTPEAKMIPPDPGGESAISGDWFWATLLATMLAPLALAPRGKHWWQQVGSTVPLIDKDVEEQPYPLPVRDPWCT